VKFSVESTKEGTPSRGSRLKARREELGMSQKELAARTGISRSLIGAYERDRVQPRKENRRLVAKALNCPWPDESPVILHHRTAPPPPAPTFAERMILCVWIDEQNELAAIEETRSGLVTIRSTGVTPTMLDDLRALVALVERRVASFVGGDAPTPASLDGVCKVLDGERS
jgi:transcriptional regulator with XRE-family HTH domain